MKRHAALRAENPIQMLKKVIFLSILSLITFFSAKSAGLEKVIGQVDNGYNYWFYCPADEEFTEEDIENGKPLVIFLHGRSLCGTDLDKVRRYGTISAIEKGRKIDSFVIAPQNPGGSWDPEKIMNVVDYVTYEYNIDMSRIYVLGMSLGGYGAIDFAATYPDRIAAAIGMCGGATVKNLDGLAGMPLWIVHGTGDSKVPVSKSDIVVEKVKAAQADGVNRLQYDRVPGMDHSKPARMFYHPDTYEWLFKHRLDTPGRPMHPTVKIDDSFWSSAYSSLNHSKGYKASSNTHANVAKKSDKNTAASKVSSKKEKSLASAKSKKNDRNMASAGLSKKEDKSKKKEKSLASAHHKESGRKPKRA